MRSRGVSFVSFGDGDSDDDSDDAQPHPNSARIS